MVHWLTEALVEQGHDVTLFAAGDSESSATVHPVCQRNLIDAMNNGEAYQYECYANAAVAEAMCHATLLMLFTATSGQPASQRYRHVLRRWCTPYTPG